MSAPADWDEWLIHPIGRGHLKRIGQMLDSDSELRGRLLDELKRRGKVLPEDFRNGAGKRLMKYARGREMASRAPSNLIQRDEGFLCGRCGDEVPPLSKTSRDHCPGCLWSRHVDVVPGDRANDCGGMQRPVGASLSQGIWRIRYQCERCGSLSQCRAAGEGTSPDDWEALVALASQGESA